MEALELPSLAQIVYEGLHLNIDHLTFELVFYSVLGAFVWMALAVMGTRKMSLVPGRLQGFLEFTVESLWSWFAEIMGSRQEAKRYLPFVGSFFLYILTLNYLGMIPFLHAPTAFLGTTIPLAILAILGTWGIAISRLGVVGFFRHLAGEGPVFLLPLNFVLHTIGELARVLSLSMRLFGNIFAEDTVLAVFVMIAGMFLKFLVPLVLPIFFMVLMILFGFLQAVIFSSLTAAYIAQWIEGHHEEGHPAGHSMAGAPAPGH
ncbi:MAG: F0F1 ATP synthase subunit A [bacterium JZ-2024 1]